MASSVPAMDLSSNFLKVDDTAVQDPTFIDETRASLALCGELQEEIFPLSEVKYRASNNARFLDVMGYNFRMPENRLSFGQYCSALGIPPKLATLQPETLNTQMFDMHTQLKTTSKEQEVLLKWIYNTTTKDNELMAFLPGKFQTVSSLQLFEDILATLGGTMQVDPRITQIDPYGMSYMRVISPHFLPGDEVDKLFLAYDFSFAECVDCGVTLGLGLWRQVCSNGLAVPAMDGQEAFKHPYRGLDPDVPAFIFSRLLEQVLKNDQVGQRLQERSLALQNEQMDKQTTMERLAYHRASPGFIKQMEEQIIQDDARTQWDLLNDLTQAAQGTLIPQARRKTERAVGLTFDFSLNFDMAKTRKKKAKKEVSEEAE